MDEHFSNSIRSINELEKLQKLNEIARKINSATDLREILELILRQGLELLEVPYGDIWLVEKQTGDLLLQDSRVKQDLTIERKRIERGKGVIGWVVENKVPLVLDDVEADQRYLGLLPGMKSELAFPLILNDDVIGVINFESEKRSAFSNYEKDLLQALAGHAVIAIRNARTIRREEALKNIHKAFLDSKLDLNSTLSILIQEGLRLLETKKGQILLLDGNESLTIVASIPSNRTGQKLEINGCVSGKAVKEKKTIYIEDVTQEPLYERILGEEIIAEIVTPLILDDVILGVFNIENSYRFSEYDKQLLETLADQAAIAIKNAQLVESLQLNNKHLLLKEQQLRAFKDIDEAIINPSLVFGDVLRVILEKALFLIGAEKGQLLLREKDRLNIQVVIGELSNPTIESIGMNEGVIGAAARAKQPQIVSNVFQNEHYIEIIKNTKSELAYPLLDDEKVVAVLNAESEVEGYFNKEHINVLDSIKSQVLIAIQNAELQEVIKQLGEIISDINAAKSINETLERILDVGLSLLGVSSGQLLEVDDNARELIIKVTRGEEATTKKSNRIPMDGMSISSYVALAGTSLIVTDVLKDNRYISYLKDMKSELAVPLLINGRAIGVINCESPEIGYFTKQHETILSLLANGAAIAIENARSREKLSQLEVLATMGESNAEMIHWISNKTTPLLGCAARILEDIQPLDFDQKESVIEDLEIIRKNADMILEIKQNFVGVTKKLEMLEIDLEDVLQDVITEQHIRTNSLVLNIESNLPRIKGDSMQINRVISDLLKNAEEAMENIEPKELRIALRPDNQNRKVVLEISDNGCGIKEEDLSRIFFPFFTTKPRGTGLGLCGVNEMLRKMGADIFVTSEVGKGTTFTIDFQAIDTL